MKTKLTIEYREDKDGIGRPYNGYRICDWGVPVGPAFKTYDEVRPLVQMYCADIAQLNRL